MKQTFNVISHTADIKIGVSGSSLEELFAHAASAMFQIIKPKTKHADCVYEDEMLVCKTLPVTRTITIASSVDRESLLVDFLSEALALSDIHNEAYLAAQVTFCGNNSLSATLQGIPIIGFEVTEIKAVTYAGLEIQYDGETWSVEIVFDI